MTEWTPDPERHRPEGMEMAGRVGGVRTGDDCCARLERTEELLEEKRRQRDGREQAGIILMAERNEALARLERAEEALRQVSEGELAEITKLSINARRIARAYFDSPADEETGIRLVMGEDPTEMVPSDGLCRPETT